MSSSSPDRGPSWEPTPLRYTYPTHGVCPGEVEVAVAAGRLREVRFLGGGCPGTEALAGRLLIGKTLEEAAALVAGIDCRNGTSCPDQLAAALTAIREGLLPAGGPCRVAEDPTPRRRVALVGYPGDDPRDLDRVLQSAADAGAEAAYLVGGVAACVELIEGLVGETQPLPVWPVLGAEDVPGSPALSSAGARLLSRLPDVLSFRIGDRPGVGFAGEHLLDRPGFSDFARFALEMNMVCRLSGFLRDASVFPALAAMTPQFSARIVVFRDPESWRHREVGGVDFVGVGPVREGTRLTWGLLEDEGGRPRLAVREVRRRGGS